MLLHRPPKTQVEGRHDDHIEEHGGEEPAEDDRGHRGLDLVAGLLATQGQRNQRQAGRQGRHQDRGKPLHGAPKHRLAERRHAFVLLQVANMGHEHDAVARGNPEDGDKPDERSHREHPTGGIDPGDAADQRQRQVHHDERRIAEGPKGQRQEKPDTHDHRQTEHGKEPSGVCSTLKLPTIGHAIAGLCRQERVYLGGNILYHRGDVASCHVTHDDDFALHLFAADGIGSRRSW